MLETYAKKNDWSRKELRNSKREVQGDGDEVIERRKEGRKEGRREGRKVGMNELMNEIKKE